jgi:hypothetical protein
VRFKIVDIDSKLVALCYHCVQALVAIPNRNAFTQMGQKFCLVLPVAASSPSLYLTTTELSSPWCGIVTSSVRIDHSSKPLYVNPPSPSTKISSECHMAASAGTELMETYEWQVPTPRLANDSASLKLCYAHLRNDTIRNRLLEHASH